MHNEELWQRALAAFREFQAQGHGDLEQFIKSSGIDAGEAELLRRLAEAEKQKTQVMDEVFVHTQKLNDQELLKNRQGEQLGEYRLLELIGSGGMSAVYLAQRTDTDIQKQVVVKILLFPSLSEKVVALFLQEQRLLSTLNHPNIVSMLHGAVAADGTPYLVMEYIPGGRTIDHWAAGKTPHDIVAALLPLCDAIAHAHSHLIVHSDIKPGNVLVDQNNTVKLLDFGIASFLRQQQEDHPQAFSPAYASPEQLAGEKVTIASDIYSCGLLLFRLLSGEEPVQTQGNRHEFWAQLDAHAIDTELKSIIRKATQPAPRDRYANILALQNDLRRWLESKPVAAHPGRHLYRLRKFIQRRRAFSTALALLLASIFLGFFLLAAENRKTRLEAQKAREVTRFMLEAFTVTDPDQAQGIQVSARDILANAKRRFTGQPIKDPAIRDALRAAIAAAEGRLGDYAESYATVKPLLDQDRPLPEAVDTGLEALIRTGKIAQAKALFNRHGHRLAPAMQAWWNARLASAEDRFEDALQWLETASRLNAQDTEAPDPTFAIRLLALKGQILFDQGHTNKALSQLQQALETALQNLGAQHSLTMTLQGRIATLYNDQAEFERAHSLLQSLLQAKEQHLGKNHPLLIPVLLQLAGNRQFQQDYEQAHAHAQRALALAEQQLGPNSLMAGRARNLVGIVAFRQGRLDQAIEELQHAAAIYKQHLGAHHRETGEILTTLANLLLAAGRSADAIEHIQPVVAFQMQKLGPEHKATIYSQLTLIKALAANKQPQDAADLAEQALANAKKSMGESHPMVTGLLMASADALAALGRHGEAIEQYQSALASPFLQQQKNRRPLILAKLAGSQYALGQTEDARASARQAIALAEDIFGADHPQTKHLKAQLATMVEGQKAPSSSH